nr:preprotein translocase subunit YajC [Brevibacterium sp. XM4083]
MLIPLALAALLIFFLFNSRRKQKARAEQIKTNLVPGAKVMTTFGVFGTVLSIDDEDNQVTIESGPGTILRVHRQAIGQIDTPDTAVDAAPATEATDSPAITDAELDAMNERKRAEAGDDDIKAADADVDAADADLKADRADAKADRADAKATDADLKADRADEKALDADLKADNADLKADNADRTAAEADAAAKTSADDVDGSSTEDPSKGTGTDKPDTDDKKN